METSWDVDSAELEDYVRSISAGLDCYIIFNSDRHLNEYIGPQDMRVRLISGFEGSNGTVIYSREPCLITDSRYYIAAETQSRFPLYKGKVSEYLILKGYKRVSFDTRTISSASFASLQRSFAKNGIEFIETDFRYEIPSRCPENRELIDLEQKSLEEFLCRNEHSGMDPHIIEYLRSLGLEDFGTNVTGSTYTEKLARIRSMIGDRALVVSELDTIAWILNLRGSDIDFNPLFYSYLVVSQGSAILFTDKTVRRDVEVRKYNQFEEYIRRTANTPVLVSGDCNQFIFSQLKNAALTQDVRAMQATKNEVELAGMALSYFFDGIALTELFAFIQNNQGFTEADLSNELHKIKSGFKGYVGPSFDTISSTGSNAAIVHHKASECIVDKSKVYLIDSGSHYFFGTTDTTRTLFYGESIDEDLQHDYTLVLKGQLDAMIRVYGSGDKYSDIDLASRKHLKEENKNYGHATGHGVGHFLCVHEHPPIAHPDGDEGPVRPNQVFSVEPGYYREGLYGIRIENLVISRKTSDGIRLANITMVPYQRRMVDADMLSAEEKAFYNDFSRSCFELLKKYLSYEAYEFLRENTLEIG